MGPQRIDRYDVIEGIRKEGGFLMYSPTGPYYKVKDVDPVIKGLYTAFIETRRELSKLKKKERKCSRGKIDT